MKVSINREALLEIEELYETVAFKTKEGELLFVTMRDSGFEIVYRIHPCDKGTFIELKNDKVIQS